MKKFFTLVAALMMLSASAETLDLYNSDAYTYLMPINTYTYEVVGTKSQTLYLASDLASMAGKQIKSLTYYTDENGCYMDGGKVDFYVGETELVGLDDYVTEGLTKVATVSMTRDNNDTVKIVINFDTPYTYNGGNLVVSTEVVEAGNDDGMTYFMGQETNYNSAIAFRWGSLEPRQFLPHTTFEFGEGGDTPEPEVLRGDVNKDGTVAIADVTTLIDMLLSGAEMIPEADCNLDGAMAIADVTCLIDYLLSGEWPAPVAE